MEDGGRRGEEGTVLILALLALLGLTLIGISSIHTTNFENIITGNDRSRIEAFYRGEWGAVDRLNQISTLVDERKDFHAPGLTHIGGERYYDASVNYEGPAFDDGGSEFGYMRFRAYGRGEFAGTSQEVEVQVSYGPFPLGTNY